MGHRWEELGMGLRKSEQILSSMAPYSILCMPRLESPEGRAPILGVYGCAAQ